jgi:hypothetical protein
MQELTGALMCAVSAAADQARDETTVLVIDGAPAAVIAPYGHHRRPGAVAGIAFDKTAPPQARLVLTDAWGGSIRMSLEEFRLLTREGLCELFTTMALLAGS